MENFIFGAVRYKVHVICGTTGTYSEWVDTALIVSVSRFFLVRISPHLD